MERKNPPGPIAKLGEARAIYDREVARLAHLLRSSPHYSRSTVAGEQAEYLIEQVRAVAFNLLISPRPHYPKLLVDTLFGPNLFPIWGPNPDFKYGWTWLDGAKRYRIWGERRTTDWASFQVTSGFWGDPGMRTLGDFTFDGMAFGEDGSYEIVVGGERCEGNWIPLDAQSGDNFIFLRRAMLDWEKESVATVHIEMLDAPDASFHLGEQQLATRIARAGVSIVNAIIQYPLTLSNLALEKVGLHRFHVVTGETEQDGGYNPGAYYAYLVYQLQPGEALVVEAKLAKPRYWGIHATDIWLQSLDYVFHQASLNGAQALPDEDGTLRFVLSLEDPGVPNWLDPAGTDYGMLQFRSYYSEAAPQVSAKLVSLASLRANLPEKTPWVTPEARRDSLRRRARALLQHYSN